MYVYVGILIVINIGVVWGRANGAVWGSRKVRRKGCIRAMGDVPLVRPYVLSVKKYLGKFWQVSLGVVSVSVTFL